MPVYASSEVLLRVTGAKKNEADRWVEGVRLEKHSGRSIAELRQRAVLDRWRLADEFRRRGRRLMSRGTASNRDAVSRFYYAMYHATRAVVYLSYGGDDHDDHTKLPTQLPGDFPSVQAWQTHLKNARFARNGADYDPYPKSDAAWQDSAQELEGLARDYLKLTATYCGNHGCPGF